jgi:hypothetical protein
VIACVCLLMAVASSVKLKQTHDMRFLTSGIRDAESFIEANFGERDAILHATHFDYFPALYYSGGRHSSSRFIAAHKVPWNWGATQVRASALIGDLSSFATNYDRVWFVRIDPEDREFRHVYRSHVSNAEYYPRPTSAERWTKTLEQRFGNIVVILSTVPR